MERFEALLHRRAVRSYAPEAVSDGLLKEIDMEIRKLPLLFKDVELEVELVREGEKIHQVSRGIIGDIGKNTAPHYIVLSGRPAEGMRENAGFAGEHLMITMVSKGLATCWLGGAVRKKEQDKVVDTKEGHELAALIAFGNPAVENGHIRSDLNGIPRKPLEQLMADGRIDTEWKPLLEAARIAPSAVNIQPWRFLRDGERLHCYISKPNFLLRKLLGQINHVDMGIALCHLAEAAAHHKKKIRFEKIPEARRDDLIYIVSAVGKKL